MKKKKWLIKGEKKRGSIWKKKERGWEGEKRWPDKGSPAPPPTSASLASKDRDVKKKGGDCHFFVYHFFDVV